MGITLADSEHDGGSIGSFAGDRVDYYVRCSMRSAFTKVSETYVATTPISILRLNVEIALI